MLFGRRRRRRRNIQRLGVKYVSDMVVSLQAVRALLKKKKKKRKKERKKEEEEEEEEEEKETFKD